MMSMIQDQAYGFIIQNNQYLLLNKDNTLPHWRDIKTLSTDFVGYFPLGMFKNSDYFCAEIDPKIRINDDFHRVPLRQGLSLLEPDLYNIAVKAYSVINWDRSHQFCGRCGARTVHQAKNFERVCASCNLSFFPRISPSIIVLIYKEDHLVMARSPHFLPGVYGLIAGFVDVGECLEEAVHREVKEEVGLQIKNLSYFGSQPWPFPDSLMIAFTAEYAAGEIVIDNDEIEEAGWYKYDNLPGRPSMSMSIASTLLDNFVSRCGEKYRAGLLQKESL